MLRKYLISLTDSTEESNIDDDDDEDDVFDYDDNCVDNADNISFMDVVD